MLFASGGLANDYFYGVFRLVDTLSWDGEGPSDGCNQLHVFSSKICLDMNN